MPRILQSLTLAAGALLLVCTADASGQPPFAKGQFKGGQPFQPPFGKGFPGKDDKKGEDKKDGKKGDENKGEGKKGEDRKGPKPDPVVDAWVAVLIAKITDPHDTVRDSARGALVGVGPPALPALQALADGNDPAKAVAARKLIGAIQGNRGPQGPPQQGPGGPGRPGFGGPGGMGFPGMGPMGRPGMGPMGRPGDDRGPDRGPDRRPEPKREGGREVAPMPRAR